MRVSDTSRIQEGKRAVRRQLAQRPAAEKLRLLDDLRERAIAIKKAAKDYRTTLQRLV